MSGQESFIVTLSAGVTVPSLLTCDSCVSRAGNMSHDDDGVSLTAAESATLTWWPVNVKLKVSDDKLSPAGDDDVTVLCVLLPTADPSVSNLLLLPLTSSNGIVASAD